MHVGIIFYMYMNKVIITGASEGLGFELARLFVEKGVEVVSICRTNPRVTTTHIPTDLTKKEDILNTIETIKKEHDSFDAIIHSAGIASRTPLDLIDYDEMEALFKVNVFSGVQLVSGLTENIKTSEADIVMIGSTIAYKTFVDQSTYTASKWSVLGFVKNLQLEYKDLATRVIGFMPGGFKSTLHEKATGETYDLSDYMEPEDLAKFLIQILELPKSLEISEVSINRKVASIRKKA